MKEIIKHVDNICTLIFSFSDMDTYFIDDNFNTVINYSYNLLPISLQPHFAKPVDFVKNEHIDSKQMVSIITTTNKTNFISTKVHFNEKYIGNIILGPYLIDEPSLLMIEDVLFENKLSILLKTTLNQYYASLPLISPYKAKKLAEFLVFNINNLNLRSTKDISIETIEYKTDNQDCFIPYNPVASISMSVKDINTIYRLENRLIEAIEKSDKKEVERLTKEFLSIAKNIPDRLPQDVIRSRKNLSIVLNTLLRKAAEKGGLDSITLHSISERFAIEIEKATNIATLLKIINTMVQTYCSATRKYSLKDYTYTTRKIIEYIRSNLDQDLSLINIATSLNLSVSELSRQFKKETNISLVDYINIQRINEATYLLQNQKMLITDIAYMVGFNDGNYFTKVFKKVKGITPSKYRQKIG